MSEDGGEFAHRAAERELERLKRFGARLAELAPRAGAERADLEALQDVNLAAFERMTEDVGVAALDRMVLLAGELRATLEAAADPAAAARIAPRMRAAAEELDALRDRETERLLDRIATLFEAPEAARDEAPEEDAEDDDARRSE